MSEDEAKLKWCPFARPGAVRPEDCGEVRGNRQMDGAVDPGTLCIGSSCMAWRWIDRDTPSARQVVDRCGFCGLAGAPQ